MRDPTRRNRNQGTAKQGHSKDTTFVVPQGREWWRSYAEGLVDYVHVERFVYGTPIQFLIEPVEAGYVHPCTPDDVVYMLELLPAQAVEGPYPLRGIVMRQAPKKENILNGCWGRFSPSVDLGPVDGAAIFLEAAVPWKTWQVPTKLSLEGQGEARRLDALLERLPGKGKGNRYKMGFAGLRRWVLYHTLIHEIGHWMDYRRMVVWPSERSEIEVSEGIDAYWARPRTERESFAHRFSDEWRDELTRRNRGIPFEQQLSRARLKDERIDPSWFAAPTPEEAEAGPPVGCVLRERREPMFHLYDWHDPKG